MKTEACSCDPRKLLAYISSSSSIRSIHCFVPFGKIGLIKLKRDTNGQALLEDLLTVKSVAKELSQMTRNDS